MDRTNLAVVGRLAMAGVLCAGALIGSACGRSPSTGPSAVAAGAAGTGDMEGEAAVLTPAELTERGWSCRVTPNGLIGCSPPGRGLPEFGAPEDRPPSYVVHVFTPTSEYLGFARFIRTDLYQGQTCPATGEAYVFRAHIGYYECFKPAS